MIFEFLFIELFQWILSASWKLHNCLLPQWSHVCLNAIIWMEVGLLRVSRFFHHFNIYKFSRKKGFVAWICIWLGTSVRWLSHIVAPSRVFPLIKRVLSCLRYFLHPSQQKLVHPAWGHKLLAWQAVSHQEWCLNLASWYIPPQIKTANQLIHRSLVKRSDRIWFIVFTTVFVTSISQMTLASSYEEWYNVMF